MTSKEKEYLLGLEVSSIVKESVYGYAAVGEDADKCGTDGYEGSPFSEDGICGRRGGNKGGI